MFAELVAALLLQASAPAVEASPAQPNPPPMLTANPYSNPFPIRSTEISPEEFAERCDPWDDWDKPVAPFRVAPGVWYVGTCGITVLLVPTPYGDVLLDTGTKSGARAVYKNLGGLRRVSTSIGLILYSHEHFDHVGGLALMQKMSGAPVVASPSAAEVLRTGEDNPSDPQAGMHDPMDPAPNIVVIEPGIPVLFGGIEFLPIATPGHTPGALSWQWKSCEGQVCKTIVYADSLSPVSSDDYRFSDYPEYVAEYRAGLERLRGLECDILLTPHPSASKMIERAATGTFEGGITCVEYADAVERRLDNRLASEAEGQ